MKIASVKDVEIPTSRSPSCLGRRRASIHAPPPPAALLCSYSTLLLTLPALSKANKSHKTENNLTGRRCRTPAAYRRTRAWLHGACNTICADPVNPPTNAGDAEAPSWSPFFFFWEWYSEVTSWWYSNPPRNNSPRSALCMYLLYPRVEPGNACPPI